MQVDLFEQTTFEKIVLVENKSTSTKEHYILHYNNIPDVELIKIGDELKIKTIISSIIVALIDDKKCNLQMVSTRRKNI